MRTATDLTPEEWQEWSRRSSRRRSTAEALADPIWRLCWIYTIEDDSGGLVPFRPTPEQIVVIACIYIRGWRRLLIPKARQLGMSTVLVLIAQDRAQWTSGTKAALVDKTGNDAVKKVRHKMHVAWRELDEAVREQWTAHLTDAGITLERPDQAASTVEAGIGYRGGTVHFLHISEWGWIQANDPRRSREIRDGSLPAAERCPDSVVAIETTWDGGKTGELWPFVTEALETPERDKDELTWRILFFPWWSHPGYARKSGYIDSTSAKYFEQLALEGVELSIQQRYWYAQQRRTLGYGVYQEYPSLLRECWERPSEGAIYGVEIADIQASGRLREFELVPELPVFAFWDLGLADFCSIWFVQLLTPNVLWLDFLEDEGQMIPYYWARLKEWEDEFKPVSVLFLPHDGDQRRITGTSAREQLSRLGARSVVTVPRSRRVWDGINALRPILRRSIFHPRTDQSRVTPLGKERLSGFACLGAYRTKVAQDGAAVRPMPLHDHSSNAADAGRLVAEALSAGLVPSQEAAVHRERSMDDRRRRRRRGAKMGVGG